MIHNDILAPQELDAERAVLGSCLHNGITFNLLRPEHFYSTSHRGIAESIIRLHNKGDKISLLTVRNDLRNERRLEHIGGEVGLAELFDQHGLYEDINFGHHENLIIEAAKARNVLVCLNKTIYDVANNGGIRNLVDHVHTLRDQLDLAIESDMMAVARPISEIMELGVDTIPYVIDRIIPERDITLFSGDGGTGKSYIVLELARCVAKAKPFLGKFEIHKPGRVLLVDYENGPLRMCVRSRSMGIPKDSEIHIVDDEAITGDFIDKPAGMHQVLSMVKQIQPVVTIIDSCTASMSGDENNPRDTRSYFTNLKRIAKRGDTSILLIHHNRKVIALNQVSAKERVRGSTDFINAPSTAFALEKVKDNLRKFLQTKARDFADIDPIGLLFNRDEETGSFTIALGELPAQDSLGIRSDSMKNWQVIAGKLAADGGGYLAELCESLGIQMQIDRTNVRRNIYNMRDKGFVECEKHTGHKSLFAKLTEQGMSLLSDANEDSGGDSSFNVSD